MNGTGRRRLLATGAAVLMLGSIAAFVGLRSRSVAPPPAPRVAHAAQAKVVERVEDPLWPGHPAQVREVPDQRGGGIAAPRASSDEWARARPAAELRAERSASERGGVQPCNTSDPGFGEFMSWRSAGGGWFTMPERGVPRDDGSFELALHFHGHELARKEFVGAGVPFVLFGSSAGNYRSRLSGTQAFSHIVSLVEKLVSDHAGRPARAARVLLAAWSGGYEAVGVLLEQSSRKPDAVLLLDGLHFSRARNVASLQMAPFLEYAKQAAAGQGTMFVSHSSIDTDGFASSTESVHQLIAALGGRPLRVEREDPLGLQLVEMFSMGNFHVRGYAGGGKPDHCAHLALYPMVLQHLQRHWSR